jgi:hypothetical protein
MPRLNNPYLNAKQLLLDLHKKQTKEHLYIKRIQQTLSELYFPTLSSEEALSCLATDPRFSDYPCLKAVLGDLLESEHADLDVLQENMTGQDWQALPSESTARHR